MRVAVLSGDTLLLSTRHGLESVFVDREFGDFLTRADYLDIGAGSQALLAWPADDEIRAVLDLLAPAFEERYPRITRHALEAEIGMARQRGYAMVLDVVVEQMGGIVVPIRSGDGKRVAATSLAALSQRTSDRLPILVPAMIKAAAELSAPYVQRAAA